MAEQKLLYIRTKVISYLHYVYKKIDLQHAMHPMPDIKDKINNLEGQQEAYLTVLELLCYVREVQEILLNPPDMKEKDMLERISVLEKKLDRYFIE